MTDYATTGDGLVGALQILAALIESGKPASQLTRVFAPVPQKLVNVRYQLGQTPLDTDRVKSEIQAAEKALGAQGRVLIRKSGTEPLIRIMAEAESSELLHATIDRIKSAVEEVTA